MMSLEVAVKVLARARGCLAVSLRLHSVPHQEGLSIGLLQHSS